MIRFRCFRCNHMIRCPDEYAGKVVRCPSCKDMTFVPPTLDDAEAALAAAAPQLPAHSDEQPAAGPADEQSLSAAAAAEVSQTRGAMKRHQTLRAHHYAWLKFMGSAYISLGVVAAIMCVIRIFMQLSESLSQQAQGRVHNAADIFAACVWLLGGLAATLTLFALGQCVLAFRDMVINSWVTRELAVLQRAGNRV